MSYLNTIKRKYICGFYVCVCVSSATQLCLTFCNPMDCSPPGSSVHGILQAISFGVGCNFLFQGIFLTPGIEHESLASPELAKQILYLWVTWEALIFISIASNFYRSCKKINIVFFIQYMLLKMIYIFSLKILSILDFLELIFLILF